MNKLKLLACRFMSPCSNIDNEHYRVGHEMFRYGVYEGIRLCKSWLRDHEMDRVEAYTRVIDIEAKLLEEEE